MNYRTRQHRPKDPKTGRFFRVVKPPILTPPPPNLCRATLDNIALVPASLLPFKTMYQAIANELPAGEVLIVLPASAETKRKLHKVADLCRARGQHVTIISSDTFR